MADLLLATDRVEDLLDLVRGLEAAGHRLTIRPPEGVVREDMPACQVALVDGVKDFFKARDTARVIRATQERTVILALISADHVDGIGPDWMIDSFLLEPASIPECLARLRLVVTGQLDDPDSTIRAGDLVIDPESYQAKIKGRPLDLTYKEFQLLSFLAGRPGRVWSRQQLLQEVWGYDFFGGTRTVDVHVRRLRAKLGPEYEAMIGTIRNVGYKLDARTR
ncbi:MAG: winged helix-turn-helix domain-containing protein [Actinomycetota bacterium]